MIDLSTKLHALRTEAQKDLEIAGKATEGPWTEYGSGYEAPFNIEDGVQSIDGDIVGASIPYEQCGTPTTADARFIAHSRTALPASASAVLRLTMALEICDEILAISAVPETTVAKRVRAALEGSDGK